MVTFLGSEAAAAALLDLVALSLEGLEGLVLEGGLALLLWPAPAWGRDKGTAAAQQ